MYCDFSETQFVFCILKQFYEVFPTLSMPFFPTQKKEKDLGFDTEIETPFYTLFLQFKVPEYKKKRNAKYYQDFNSPYLVFKVYDKRKSKQHETLTQLATDHTNRVYYCTPVFNTNRELKDYYKKKKILNHTILIDCSQPVLQNLSSGEHHITYEKTDIPPIRAFLHSEDYLEVKVDNFKSLMDNNHVYASEREFVDAIKKSELNIGNASSIDEISEELLNRYNICLLTFPVGNILRGGNK